MPLRSPRFTGDPILEACLDGSHRMQMPEDGIAVKRVQAALIELGFPVGATGADGIFGLDTGAAVSAYKASKGLVPDDPVVGPGTMQALDDDLFVDPPELDPAFGSFSPAVANHRLEPFLAIELDALETSPLNSWRRMIGRFALSNLSSRQLLGIVSHGRREDLRTAYRAIASPVQERGLSADGWFDDQTNLTSAHARTVTFSANDGSKKTLIVVRDDVILERATIARVAGTRAPVTLLGVIAHELSHVRNLANRLRLLATPDTDTNTYADTALAQARSATGQPTVNVLRSFVEEICARHIHWILLKEQQGNASALNSLQADQLAAAATFYFYEVPVVYDSNGYGAGIRLQGGVMGLRQLHLWLMKCFGYSFSDDASEEVRTQELFRDAALVCADLASNPGSSNSAMEDGLFPLPADFH